LGGKVSFETQVRRARTLNTLLVVASIVAAPLIVIIVVETACGAVRQSVALVCLLLCLCLVVLVASFRLNYHLTRSAQASEARYRAICELISDLAYDIRVDPDSTLTVEWVSSAFVCYTDAVPDELGTIEDWIGLVHPDDRPAFLQDVKRLFSGRQAVGTIRLLVPNGEMRWLRVHNRPVWSEAEGRVVRIYGLAQDMTECKLAEKALQESAGMAQALLDASTDSAFLLNRHGKILALNQTAAQRLDKSVDDLVGRFAHEILPPDLSESRMAMVRQVVRSGKPVRFGDERDGRFFDTNMHPIFDGQGEVTRVAVFARDVTELRQAEQRASQAERLATIEQVAAVLAHEINNPLQAIQSNLDLALDFDVGQAEREECLSVARQEIGRLAEIAGRVLDLGRSAHDTRVPVSIADLMRRTLTLTGRQLADAGIRLTADLAEDLPPAMAAPDQVIQVFMNLITNALEAMTDGGHMQVEVRADGDRIVVVVANDGPPIAPEHIEHVFDPFFTTRPDGVGLGLAVSRSIIRQHGGSISVENQEGGRGVAFTITLPVFRAIGEEVTT